MTTQSTDKEEGAILCPTCSEPLNRMDSRDINRVQYRCDQGHWFHRFKSVIGTPVEWLGRLQVYPVSEPLFGNDNEVLEFWLTDSDARAVLGNSAAELAVGVLAWRAGETGLLTSQPFQRCPVCGAALSRTDEGDMYVTGLRCLNGHDFGERSRRLTSQDVPDLILHAEMSTEELLRNIGSIDEDGRRWCHVPESMAGVFKRFCEEAGTPEAGPSG